MTLTYKMCDDRLLLIDKKDGEVCLEILCPEAEGGLIQIGKRSGRITGGKATVSLKGIKEGICRPVLLFDAKIYDLEPLYVYEDDIVAPHGTKERIHSNLGYIALSERLKAAEQALRELADAVFGKTIF